ncbi:S1 RNA-binding domain-containing protein [Vibrio sp. 10N.261.46.A3]
MSQVLFEKGQAFKAVITRVEHSLEAVFVDYGNERHGFLPMSKIAMFDEKKHKNGYVLTVIIEEPEHGNKGASLNAPLYLPQGTEVHELINVKPSKSKMAYLAVACLFVILVLAYTNA